MRRRDFIALFGGASAGLRSAECHKRVLPTQKGASGAITLHNEPLNTTGTAARAAAGRQGARVLIRFSAMFFAAFTTAGLSFSALAQNPGADRTILVFAATSLLSALDNVDRIFTRATGIKVTARFDASSTLMKQMEGGAYADVFVSADLDWMDYGTSHRLIEDDTRINLLGNRLVLITAKDSPIEDVIIGPGFDLTKLAGNGRIVTGNIRRRVPFGIYAKAALEELGAWGAVEPKMAMADTVRVATALVARGDASLGIVYASDAKVEPNVKVIGTFPESSHPPIVYPAAATRDAKVEAKRYLEFLRSAAAGAVFEDYGFVVLAQRR
jgi:molybdate transport system substrate-binding protein